MVDDLLTRQGFNSKFQIHIYSFKTFFLLQFLNFTNL